MRIHKRNDTNFYLIYKNYNIAFKGIITIQCFAYDKIGGKINAYKVF